MPPTLAFKTTRDAAVAVQRVAEEALQKRLIALPYNRFEGVEGTTWWLAPFPDNPAFRFGKIAFKRLESRRIDPEPPLFVGLYVERGLNPEWAAKPSEGMDATWLWNSFMQDVKSDALHAPLDTIEKSCTPLIVAIDGGTCREDWDILRFEYAKGRLASRTEALGHLKPLNDARTLTELPDLLASSTQPGAVWIDFLVGYEFLADNNPTWAAADVWHKLCEPLKGWLRSGIR